MGHDPKSGRADICVSNPEGKTLFIIECKTSGYAYEKAYNDTNNDGAQLFSYWQQDGDAQWLVLYASDYANSIVSYRALTINCKDDPNTEIAAQKDKTIKLYSEANNAKEKHKVWVETYSKNWLSDLIFSEDSCAYKIGLKPLRKKNLKDFSPDDKIVNKFEEILRHNNVSDKENAFNRLVALFICKLVDEITKADDDIVEFQYKFGTDTYEILQDRLQRLHKEGMETFMHENIYYVAADYPEWLFSNYTGQKRQNAIDDLKDKIRILKFFSNNDFSFKDVHNEELFYQNGKILVEVVQLFENYRIVYPSKHQFLGDLFEQLLNKGFKQNEGQFFTPMPVTRFIWDCLPVEHITHTENGILYPKIIDYACGAGHFLTEAVETINSFIASDNNDWARDHIFGIEKDYRLARVAKISLYMNGAGEGNIIFGDGLENLPERHIENNSFNILVANPPYSVKDFKQHLNLKNNNFKLLNSIGKNGSEIEVLFIERIVQLLKPESFAAVILPSSILSNDSASYSGAREQILQNFLIRAIVQLGSKTFGATGTNTVILFLEKYNESPKYCEILSDSVTAILSGANLDDWKDKDIYENYLIKIDVTAEDYRSFLSRELSLDDFSSSVYFKMYVETFFSEGKTKSYINTKVFKKLTEDEQKKRLTEKLYDYIKQIEAEKILYFALTYTQHTVIITAPADNAKQKEFLGYDWSNRKGSEGIQIIKPGGKLYNDSDRTAEGTLAHIVRQSYLSEYPNISENNKEYASVILTADMLDFSRSNFNKALRTSGVKQFELKTKYSLIQLKSYPGISIQKGQAITETDAISGNYKVVAGGKSFAYTHNQYNRDENVITVSASGANAGYVNFWKEKIFASDCTTIRTSNLIDTLWIYYYLQYLQDQIYRVLQKGASQPHVYMEDIKRIPIPDIEKSLKKEVVLKCQNIDETYNSTRMTIEEYRKEVEKTFNELDVIAENSGGGYKLTLSDKSAFSISIGKRVLTSELVADAEIPVFSANVYEPFGYINKLLIDDFSADSILWGIDGDWMVNFYPKDKPFYPTDHCGVLRIKTNKVNARYLTHILEREGKKHNFSRTYRASIDRIEGISFFVPNIEEQNKKMQHVEELERKIVKLEQTILSCSREKSKILSDFLL